jgi:hypothetical protein
MLFAAVFISSCNSEGGGAGNPVTGTGDSRRGTAVSDQGSRSTCRDFTTRSAAQAALQLGNTGLDGDGDGIACENLR